MLIDLHIEKSSILNSYFTDLWGLNVVQVYVVEDELYSSNLFPYYPVKTQGRQDHSSYLYSLP